MGKSGTQAGNADATQQSARQASSCDGAHSPRAAKMPLTGFFANSAAPMTAWQAIVLLVSSVVVGCLFSAKVAFALFAGGLASLLPFIIFALILRGSASAAQPSRIMLRFMFGAMVKFLLSAMLLAFMCLFGHFPFLISFAGFMLASFSLFFVPKRFVGLAARYPKSSSAEAV